MGFGRTRAVALTGVEGHLVVVEAQGSHGLPAFIMGGLPDAACAQAPDRVRAAAGNSGVGIPMQRWTVNLSPASLPKVGSGFDLANAAPWRSCLQETAMPTITDTTAAAHPAPTWAADPSTDVAHERGGDVHPDDAHTSYTRQLASWETTPEQPHLSRSTLQVTLHAWRHDDGSDDADTVCVLEQHLVAADARRLGQALLRAADLLEGPLASGADDPGVLAGCPGWCHAHAIHDEDGSISHQTSVRVGTMAAHVEQVGDGHQGGPCDPQGAAVYPPEVEWVHGHDAHDFAEAMRRAAWLVHPITEASAQG